MKSFTVSAPGKLHIIGEHAVVYGKPAILAAVNKKCIVEISEREDEDVIIVSEDLQAKMQISQDIILDRTQNVRKIWHEFLLTNNIARLHELIEDPLNAVVFAIGETLAFYEKRLKSGCNITIKSEIPIGSGMGSSGAMAASVAAGVALFLGEKLDKDIVNTISFLVEERIHGNPSGGDSATSCFGNFLWFRKESPELKIIYPLPFSITDNLKRNFFVFYTGKPKETTGEMVSLVRILYGKKPKFVENILTDLENLARKMIGALKKNDATAIIDIIKRSQRNLEELGVVSKNTKMLIQAIEAVGGAGKISGAGGARTDSGIVLAYHEDLKFLLDISKKTGIAGEQIILGAEGVKEE